MERRLSFCFIGTRQVGLGPAWLAERLKRHGGRTQPQDPVPCSSPYLGRRRSRTQDGAPPAGAMGTRLDAPRHNDSRTRFQDALKLLRSRSLPRKEQRLHHGEFPLLAVVDVDPLQRATADRLWRRIQILWNQGIFQTVMLGKAIQAVFLGDLRLIEIEVRRTPSRSLSLSRLAILTESPIPCNDSDYKNEAGSPSPRRCSR